MRFGLVFECPTHPLPGTKILKTKDLGLYLGIPGYKRFLGGRAPGGRLLTAGLSSGVASELGRQSEYRRCGGRLWVGPSAL